MYHSRVSSTSWFLAKSGSIVASGMQWNAKSHAAYQGYSHLSGIERMSALLRLQPLAVAAVLAAVGWRGLIGVAVEPCRHIQEVELLAPDHSGKRLPLDMTGIGRFDAGLNISVERVGLLAALSKEMVEIGEGGMSVASGAASA